MAVCCVLTVHLTLVADRRSGVTDMGGGVTGTDGGGKGPRERYRERENENRLDGERH